MRQSKASSTGNGLILASLRPLRSPRFILCGLMLQKLATAEDTEDFTENRRGNQERPLPRGDESSP